MGKRVKLFTVRYIIAGEGFYMDVYATSLKEAVELAKKTYNKCKISTKPRITSIESYDGNAKLALVA